MKTGLALVTISVWLSSVMAMGQLWTMIQLGLLHQFMVKPPVLPQSKDMLT